MRNQTLNHANPPAELTCAPIPLVDGCHAERLGCSQTEAGPVGDAWARPGERSFLETSFPARDVSHVIAADRRVVDPVYSVHRWWARRPPALMRALILSSILKETTSQQEFWEFYADPEHKLSGFRVLDPFAGGGSTLVEAARLGADVTGGDVDPLAVKIVRYELSPADSEGILVAGRQLLATLQDSFATLFPAHNGAKPLHYFYIAEVTCPSCGHQGPLYRSLVLVRDAEKRGAVVRDDPVTVFCPINYCLHYLSDIDQESFECCGSAHRVHSATFEGQSYRCPQCNQRSSHRELSTGLAPRRLVAVEETRAKARRKLRVAVEEDLEAIERAEQQWASTRDRLPYPLGSLSPNRRDGRPLSYGIQHAEQLFSDRQLLVLSHALQWIADADLSTPVRDALQLAVSNALATNNRLCGYATDYGRLSPLFTVRGYSLPTLPVELNPLHPTGGRGTLAACIKRVANASKGAVRRYVWSVAENQPVARSIALHTDGIQVEVRCRRATKWPTSTEVESVDLLIFDPPYFDYIAYDELSEFHRAWFPNERLAGAPLFPKDTNCAMSFGRELGACMAAGLTRVRPGRPVAFTYHSTAPEAWEAIGIALDTAGLSVTALWPVQSDGHMGHHSYEGNCEWDVVVVCRRTHEVSPCAMDMSVDKWIGEVRPFTIRSADQQNMQLALDMATTRFAHT